MNKIENINKRANGKAIMTKLTAALNAAVDDKKNLQMELVTAKEDKVKREAELIIANVEKAKRATELVIADAEKLKRADELIIADIELNHQNKDKVKRAAELVVANMKKAKRASELVVANIEKAKRAAELVVANIEKAKRAKEAVNIKKELALAKEKEKLFDELTLANKALNLQIKERELSEKELLQSYIFNESILKTIPFGMNIVDETGTILFQSDNFKEVFGESAIGNKCWELYCDNKKQCSDCPLIKGITIDKTEVYESHGVLGNRIFDISHTGIIYKGKKAMLEIFQDITERKQNEQKLLQSDRVFNLSLDMFCIAGFDGYFKYLNPAWEKTLGWSIEELLSKPWLEFVHPDDAENTENIKSDIVDGKEIYKFENRYICKDGSTKWFSWNSQPFPEENIMIGAVRDITETKKNRK